MESQTPTGATQYPVQFSVDYPDRDLNRLTTGFRLFMAIPIAIVLATLGGEGASWGAEQWRWGTTTGGLLFIAPLLLILFRQKYPRWWFDFNLELQRFTNRVGAYLALMHDRYPSTDEQQYVTLEIPYPDARRDLNRQAYVTSEGWTEIRFPAYVVLYETWKIPRDVSRLLEPRDRHIR